MRIYNNIKRLSLAILACGALTSCSDFLTENCQKALTEEEIYTDLDYTELNYKVSILNGASVGKMNTFGYLLSAQMKYRVVLTKR